jgi:zinc protease
MKSGARWLSWLVALWTAIACAPRREPLPPLTEPLTPTQDAPFRSRAPEPEPLPDRVLPEMRVDVLPNGATIAVVERPGSGLVALSLVIRGAGREPAGDPAGLAALTAELASKRARIGDGRLLDDVRIDGRRVMNEVEDDGTTFHLAVRRSALTEAVPLLVQTTTDIGFERRAFASDLVEHLDRVAIASHSVDAQLHQTALEGLYGVDHRLSRFVIGSVKTVRAISFAQAKAFRDRYYRASETVLIAAGDATLAEVRKLAEPILGSMPDAGGPPRIEASPRILPSEALRPIRAISNASAMANLMLAIPGPGMADGVEFWAFRVLVAMLAEQPRTRANAAVNHEHVRTYGIGGAVQGRYESSEAILGFSVEPEDVGSTLEAVLAELDAMQRLSHDELDLVRSRFLTGLAASSARNEALANLLAVWFAHRLPPTSAMALSETLAGLNPDILMRVARKWLRRDRLQIAAIGPPRETHAELDELAPVEWFRFEFQ